MDDSLCHRHNFYFPQKWANFSNHVHVDSWKHGCKKHSRKNNKNIKNVKNVAKIKMLIKNVSLNLFDFLPTT